MYVEIFRVVNIASGVNVISWLSSGARDVSFLSYVRFRVDVPELMSFIDGVRVVNTKPGFMVRICVDVSLVFSLIKIFFEILNSFDIVMD